MIEDNPEIFSSRPLAVLLVEDNPADAELAMAELKRAGFQVQADIVQTVHEFCARLAARNRRIHEAGALFLALGVQFTCNDG